MATAWSLFGNIMTNWRMAAEMLPGTWSKLLRQKTNKNTHTHTHTHTQKKKTTFWECGDLGANSFVWATRGKRTRVHAHAPRQTPARARTHINLHTKFIYKDTLARIQLCLSVGRSVSLPLSLSLTHSLSPFSFSPSSASTSLSPL